VQESRTVSEHLFLDIFLLFTILAKFKMRKVRLEINHFFKVVAHL